MRKEIRLSNNTSKQEPILIVEDLPDHALLLERELRKAHVVNDFLVIDNGAEALEFLSGANEFHDRNRFPLPSIILLDLKLKSQIQGFDVLAWVRSRHEFDGILVIVLSDLEHPETIRQAYEMGANTYLIKPADREELRNTIEGFKGYWLLTDEINSDSTSLTQ
jgi:DNA-binding response OmpR family regulator